jgi:hypothetical protein
MRFVAAVIVLASIVAWPRAAMATLGGDVSSIENDRVHVEGALVQIVTNGPFTVHEMRMPTGVMIREFAAGNGMVFGVAWQGQWMPDLQQLLGAYFDRYQAALAARQATRRGRAPVVIDTPDLVVHISGNQRAFSGVAYVPSMVPPGVDAHALQ